MLPHVEFTYNFMINRSTSKRSFEIVYNRILPHYLDLAKVPESPLLSSKGEDFVITMTKIHKEVKKKLKTSNQVYKEKVNKHCHVKIFEEGDFAWVFLKKERFPT